MKETTKLDQQDFKTAYCKVFNCSHDDYTQDVFLRCFPAKTVILARIIQLVNPKFFSLDLELVEKVGRATEFQQVKQAISNYFLHCGFNRNPLHGKLHIRLSCSKLQTIASQVFETNDT